MDSVIIIFFQPHTIYPVPILILCIQVVTISHSGLLLYIFIINGPRTVIIGNQKSYRLTAGVFVGSFIPFSAPDLFGTSSSFLLVEAPNINDIKEKFLL